MDAPAVAVWVLEVHAVRASLAADVARLSDAERSAAMRFRRPSDQQRSLLSRALVRRLLGQVLRQPPAAVELTPSACRWCGLPHGKPYVPDSPWRFSLSHSGDVIAFALAHDCEVGIDVEQLDPRRDPARHAAGAFTRWERAQLHGLSPRRRWLSSYQLWTRKEAYAKGTGYGLEAMGRFALSVPPAPPCVLTSYPDTTDAWTLVDLGPYPNVVGSLAARAAIASVRVRSDLPGAW